MNGDPITAPAPAQSEPVVSYTMRCAYCATTFERSFSVEDDVRAFHDHAFGFPIGGVSVRSFTTVTSRKGWWLWARDIVTTKYVRVQVHCPRCGRDNCTLISKRPLGRTA